MKRLGLLAFVLTLLIGSTGLSHFDSKEAADVFVKEYVKEQIKSKLAEFLNQNPGIVRSTDPKIGTKSIKFLSNLIAAYNLVNAKTDRERLWGSANLILTPEPATALVLFSAQLVDTLVNIGHQKDLALIYNEIAQIKSETIESLTATYISKYKRQRLIIESLHSSVDLINRLQDDIIVNCVYLKFSSTVDRPASNCSSGLSAKDFSQAIALLGEFSSALVVLESDLIQFHLEVDSNQFGVSPLFIDKIDQLLASYKTVREKLTNFERTFYLSYSLVQAKHSHAEVVKQFSRYKTDLRIYNRCAAVVNSIMTNSVAGKIEYSTDALELLDHCQYRYKMYREVL